MCTETEWLCLSKTQNVACKLSLERWINGPKDEGTFLDRRAQHKQWQEHVDTWEEPRGADERGSGAAAWATSSRGVKMRHCYSPRAAGLSVPYLLWLDELKQRKFISSLFWWLEVQDQAVGKSGFPEELCPWLADGHLTVSSHGATTGSLLWIRTHSYYFI